MDNKISIPKPCQENWDAMSSREQGRHCLSCCKTVVDFTGWDNDSILAYLKERKAGTVCGRFHTEQLSPAVLPQQELAQQVARSRMPLLRKMAAMIVLLFILGSNTHDADAQHLQGKVAPARQQEPEQLLGEPMLQPDTTTKPQPAVSDSFKCKPVIMGMIAAPPPQPKKIKKAGIRQQTRAAAKTPVVKTTPEHK